jgi:hypothetical protein
MKPLPEPIFPHTGAEFICQLPKTNGEWHIMPFKGQDGKSGSAWRFDLQQIARTALERTEAGEH